MSSQAYFCEKSMQKALLLTRSATSTRCPPRQARSTHWSYICWCVSELCAGQSAKVG